MGQSCSGVLHSCVAAVLQPCRSCVAAVLTRCASPLITRVHGGLRCIESLALHPVVVGVHAVLQLLHPAVRRHWTRRQHARPPHASPGPLPRRERVSTPRRGSPAAKAGRANSRGGGGENRLGRDVAARCAEGGKAAAAAGGAAAAAAGAGTQPQQGGVRDGVRRARARAQR